MRKETIICDHCGKEISDNGRKASLDFDCGATSVSYDLHYDCAKKIEKMLEEFCPNGGSSRLLF